MAYESQAYLNDTVPNRPTLNPLYQDDLVYSGEPPTLTPQFRNQMGSTYNTFLTPTGAYDTLNQRSTTFFGDRSLAKH